MNQIGICNHVYHLPSEEAKTKPPTENGKPQKDNIIQNLQKQMKIKAFNLGVPGSNPGGLIKKGLFTGFIPISKSFLLLSAEVKKI